MYQIHLRGTRKAVYLVRNNIIGYGYPEILYEAGTDDLYIMHCELETKYDAIPNQHRSPEKWNENVEDLSVISMDDILSGKYDMNYSDHELEVLSGMFDVEIEMLNDPDDKWWEDAESEPEYPFYACAKGKMTRNETQDSDDPEVFSF